MMPTCAAHACSLQKPDLLSAIVFTPLTGLHQSKCTCLLLPKAVPMIDGWMPMLTCCCLLHRYVMPTDPNTRLLCELDVLCPTADQGGDRAVDVSMSFGGTNVTATAVGRHSKQQLATEFKFAANLS